MRKLSVSLIGLAMAAMPAASMALTANQVVETEKVIVQADGSEKLVRSKADKVQPGDRIVYTLKIENDDAKPASDMILTMPVPAEIKYIEGSADKSGSVVTYSVDGGESFVAREDLKVADEAGAMRPASADDISHVRWQVLEELDAGAQSSLSFKGTLR